MYQFQLPEWRIDGRLFVNSQFEVVGEWKPEVVFGEGEKACALMLVERIFRGVPWRGMATLKCTMLRVLDEEGWAEIRKYIENSYQPF
jgi:hypothetical protein